MSACTTQRRSVFGLIPSCWTTIADVLVTEPYSARWSRTMRTARTLISGSNFLGNSSFLTARKRQRTRDSTHASFMTWSRIGVVTAGLAQFANREWPEQSPWPVLAVVAVATATGAVCVPRFVTRELRRQWGLPLGRPRERAGIRETVESLPSMRFRRVDVAAYIKAQTTLPLAPNPDAPQPT
jgi:hypothetical protein